MRQLLIIPLCLALSSCHSPPVIFGPNDTTTATGEVKPLAQIVRQNVKHVRLIFVHGVNDHCPGYAFGPAPYESADHMAPQQWLDRRAESLIGVRPRDDIPGPHGAVSVSTFMDESPQTDPTVVYRVRHYDWILPKPHSMIDLEAIEITWSPLTQWIKTNLLGYDSPSVFADDAAVTAGCITSPALNSKPVAPPPPRAMLNKLLKESVLDRALADAVIYVGSYGKVITRGVAEAVCHAITGTDEKQRCKWPTQEGNDAETTVYVFITHSLGSRIVYDMIMGLGSSNEQTTKSNFFNADEQNAARPFIRSLLARTPAIYMMASQLPMIGLGNVSEREPSNDVGPYATEPNLDSGELSRLMNGTNSPGRFNPLDALGRLRDEELRKVPELRRQPLNVIAFHDTDDLLTWHLPSWYSTGTNVEFTNVFLQNGNRWLGLAEDPQTAHNGYFRNPDAWKVIHCGGRGASLNPCPSLSK